MSRNVTWPAAAALVLGACVENPGSLIILDAVVADSPSGPGECVVSPGAGGGSTLVVVEGLIDSLPHALGMGPPGYILHPRVRNNLGSNITIRNSPATNEPQLNHVTVDGFEIEIEYAFAGGGDGHSQIIEDMFPPGGGYVWPAAQVVEAQAGDRVFPGIEILPGDRVTELGRLRRELSAWSVNQLFLVHIRAFGRHREREIRSATFTFPVTVCYGCLTRGLDPEGDAVNCEDLSLEEDEIMPGNNCANLPQDTGLDCCYQRADGEGRRSPVCPAPAPETQ